MLTEDEYHEVMAYIDVLSCQLVQIDRNFTDPKLARNRIDKARRHAVYAAETLHDIWKDKQRVKKPM